MMFPMHPSLVSSVPPHPYPLPLGERGTKYPLLTSLPQGEPIVPSPLRGRVREMGVVRNRITIYGIFLENYG